MKAWARRFRDEAFAAYKANRTETPPDLLEQIPWIRKTLEAMRIPVLEYDGFEADDVIGTLACRAAEQGIEVAIVSSDKDMLQLVNDRVRMMNPMKDDLWYDAEETEKYMGVQPGQVADLLALKGDSRRQHSGRARDRRQGREGFDRCASDRWKGRWSTPRKWRSGPIARACKTIATRFC